jgi:prepilin signal peptidase PulO-like enzyme (type II secretory pathway)
MPLVVLLAGWATGIGLNVLADSLPFRRRPASMDCPGCGAARSRLAYSGILASLTNREACAYCGHAAGWRPALLECVCLVAAAWLMLRNPQPLALLRDGLILAIYLLIVVIDIEHRLILFVVSIPAILVVAVMQSLDPQRGLAKTLLGGVAGFVLFYLLYLLGGLFGRALGRVRRQPLDEVAFGFGDVMLAGLIGVTVGWPGVVVALFLGIVAAGLFSLVFVLVMLARRRYTAFLPIPYGPFLVLGALAVYFGGRTAFERLLG